MLATSPITRHSVGRTFIIALSLLGAIAAAQFSVLVWAFISRARPAAIASAASVAQQPSTAAPASAAPAEDADFAADPLKTSEAPRTVEPAPAIAALTPPKPTPLQALPPTAPESEQVARFRETIGLGKLLRDRGDMTTALTRFREAAAMDPKSPEAIYEIAVTFGKMQLADKAAEQWRRIFDLGESAGPYYSAAEARLNQEKQSAMIQAAPSAGAAAESEEGIAAGKTLGLLNVASEDQEDRTAAKHLAVRIPIKARAREKVDVRDLTIQVLFYDIVDNQNLVQTTANVSSRWTSAPADWLESNLETLEVDYQLALPDAKGARRESRKYFGYLVRVYYKGELQAATGDPDKLVQQFPPEPKLLDEAAKK